MPGVVLDFGIRKRHGAKADAALGPDRLAGRRHERDLVAALPPEHPADPRGADERLVRTDNVEGLNSRERGYDDVPLPHECIVNHAGYGVNDTYPTLSAKTHPACGG